MEIKKEPVFFTIPDEEFADRKDEMDNIYQLALETANNTTNSIYLYGKRKIGKTEILKRVYNRLFWEQNKVVPFYYTFPKGFSDIPEFSKDYLREFVKQCIGFIKKQPSLIRSNISLQKLFEIIKEEEYLPLKNLIENYHEYMADRDYLEVLRNSILAPYIVSVEGFGRVFVILDDFHKAGHIKSPDIKCSLLEEFSSIFNNRFSPHLITGYSIKMRKEVFSDEVILGTSDIMELKGLLQEDVYTLFENLCKLYNLRFLKENIPLMASQLALNVFYIKSFIRSAKRLGFNIYSLKDFKKFYIYEITSGNIGFYLSSLLNTFVNEEERRTSVKVLKACTETPIEGITVRFLSDVISSNYQETVSALRALQDGGLVDVEYGRIKCIKDIVLRDFILFTYSTAIKGQEPSLVKARMIRDGLKALSRRRSHKFSEKIKIQVKNIFDSFDCQRIPEILFDFKSFSSRLGKDDFIRVSQKLKTEKDLLFLPQVIGSSEISTASTDKEPEQSFFLGYGFEEGNYEEEKEVLWICGIFTSHAIIKVNEIEEFLKEVNKIKEKMESFKTELWIVAKDGFSDKAIEKIANNKIKSSSLTQLSHLGDMLLRKKIRTEGETKEKNINETVEKNTSDNKENEFELIIPMASDTELVAVRAIEEIARRADFDQDAIGQIKMALIEACINATEHSKISGGKISLKFLVQHDKLIIYVYNEGMGFDPSLIKEPNIDEKMLGGSKRGWGIKLMKSFMDEVKFEKTNGGTKLKMTKLIKK